MANGKGAGNEEIGYRNILALIILVFSIVGVLALGITIVAKKVDNAQIVMMAVLPLLGSWVGTILAYYFSKENFEAATRSVTELAKQITPQEKLQSTLAKDTMIPKDKMFSMTAPATTKLKDILDALTNAKKGMRIPFLDEKSHPMYVIHRSMIDRFLADQGLKGTDLANLTLQDLLNEPELKNKIEGGFSLVKEDATLADVKKEMDKKPDCQDVFLTKGGAKDEPTLGWITNVIIEDNAKV